jgi:transcriptional regulator with XRE-family HTH domain
MESFGERLYQARKAQGLSLRQAAARIHHPDGRPISHQSLNAMERGHRKPSFPLLQAIGRALQFDVMPLLTPAEGAELFLRTALRDHPEAAVAFLRLFSWFTQHGDTGGEQLAPSRPALGAFLPLSTPATGSHRPSTPSLPREEEADALHEALVGTSAAMQHLRALIRRVAVLNATVLISGETGVGKELVAHALHHQSPRCHHPFVIVDCTALQESLTESTLFGHERGAFTGAIMRHQGAFERAHTGTIFLDEVHSLSLSVQAKLLRVLQARAFERVGGTYPIHVDVRVVATSNKDLSAMVAAGTFRDDLFHRLHVLPLHVPPLRARADDIPLLVQHFLQKHGLATTGQVPQLTPAAYAVLAHYPWPGNVRELEHVIMRLVSFHGPRTFDVVDLPPQLREG